MSPLPKKRPGIPIEVLADFAGRLVEIVPSVEIDLFEGLAEEISAAIERMTAHAAGVAIHGARLAGEVLTFDEEARQIVQWVLVGGSPDGRNCEDCLNLHGQQMTMAEFLNLKFTTKCDGN